MEDSGADPALAKAEPSRLGPSGFDPGELAQRCEAATGPSRELDGMIEVARDPSRETILYNEPGRFPQKAAYGPVSELALSGRDLADYIAAPTYTASLDAAITLVPGDCDWLLNARYNFAQVWEAKETGKDGNWECKHAATPALALCAAALKARA